MKYPELYVICNSKPISNKNNLVENQVAMCIYVKQILEKRMIKYFGEGSSVLLMNKQDDTPAR